MRPDSAVIARTLSDPSLLNNMKTLLVENQDENRRLSNAMQNNTTPQSPLPDLKPHEGISLAVTTNAPARPEPSQF